MYRRISSAKTEENGVIMSAEMAYQLFSIEMKSAAK
jgi:hypothetical protein